ncbi:MAG: class II aldolase/adducin family protein [Verrucomicrobiota bacterium]
MKLFAQKEAQAFVQTGAKEFRYNRDIRLTPGAKDILTEFGVKLVFDESATVPAGAASAPVAASASAPAASGSADDERLWNAPETAKLKAQICEMGRRIWIREYCDGNGGNISCRLAPDRYLCTPTGVSKGFMTPDMLCMVDGNGKQLAGTWKRTSEFMSHAAIYKSTPEAFSVCHAHPCYAGAFAIKGMQPPPRLIPELEVFVGTIAFTPYRTPGSPEMADEIFQRAPQHQSIIMGNHGVITWGKSVEDAYFKMEITDSYCRTIIHAQMLPGGASIPAEGMSDLLKMKQGIGLPDDRFDLKPAQLAEVDPWAEVCGQHGCSSPVTPWNPQSATESAPAELEPLVQKLTEEILKNLSK